ncbi:hypothetical protein JN09_001073 [Acholeplasma morum]|uniref:LptM family lipoprotein n=1 Tax=Paracholeplasma morum TaxID=264637 RepID=UPI00195E56F2|nr:hypothetical protein [Paracholeplasma morum]MBM7453740.1 hypothetical protein [Paracholeplasma morum]
MKKIMFLVVFMSLLVGLVGCGKAEKTFTGAGVTITLTEAFVEKEVVQAPLYLESPTQIFMALRETKSSLAGYGISTLDDYIEAVLNNHGKNSTVKSKEEGDLVYKYAYYESEVNDQTFGYMLLTFEGKDHFYSMNFGCLANKLEDFKEKFFDYAKTIKVE